jgi:hypothetical protein
LNAELRGRYSEPGATHFRQDPEEVASGRGALRLLDAGTAELKRRNGSSLRTRAESAAAPRGCSRGLGLGTGHPAGCRPRALSNDRLPPDPPLRGILPLPGNQRLSGQRTRSSRRVIHRPWHRGGDGARPSWAQQLRHPGTPRVYPECAWLPALCGLPVLRSSTAEGGEGRALENLRSLQKFFGWHCR